MPMQIIRDDISRVAADIIVNTANPAPLFATGIDKSIYEAAGVDELLAARKKIGDIARGDIAVTPAFHLNAKFIIHAVGPVWEGGCNGEYDILRACYEKSLRKATELECKSIAFPIIASGSNLFPKADALSIALDSINRFLMKNDLSVLLVVFDKKSFALSERVFQEVKTYIDENRIDDIRHFEYPQKDDNALATMDSGIPSSMTSTTSCILSPIQNAKRNVFSREKLLAQKDETFQECLLRLMREKRLDPPDVYKAANLDRRMFSKILCNTDSRPKKNTVIAIALALKLELADALVFLGKAGYVLATNNDFDLIIRWCFDTHTYNIIKDVNPILFEYGLPDLGSAVRE